MVFHPNDRDIGEGIGANGTTPKHSNEPGRGLKMAGGNSVRSRLVTPELLQKVSQVRECEGIRLALDLALDLRVCPLHPRIPVTVI